ncbi:MAG: hypothetical protein P1Q69_20585, partial [Candidatus Thorarchaeota archaeon]|nr:hypothetical protein [Candidatus Thorarchaeota archaeon]
MKFFPDEQEEEIAWMANLLDKIQSEKFRVQKFRTSRKGKFMVSGWADYGYLSGEFRDDLFHLKQKRNILQSFHRAIIDEQPPNHVIERSDLWALADKMAWGENPIVCHVRIEKAIRKLVGLLEPLELPRQLIQGDPDHIFFSDDEPPALIDLSWHYRPADFALAVLAVDVLSCWCKAECTCLDPEEVYNVFADINQFNQLLLRAVLRRVLEIEG